MMTTKSLDDILRDDLRDPEFVEAYLQAALEESGAEGVLIALRRIAKARESDTPAVSPDQSFAAVYQSLTNLGLNLRVVRTSPPKVGIK